MKSTTRFGARTILALSLAALLPGLAIAAKPGGTTSTSSVPLKAQVFANVVDEQYGTGCPYPPYLDGAGFLPDAAASQTASAWNFFNWNATSGTAGVYDNGTYPASSSAFLRAEFNTSDKNFLIDTRTTSPLRTFKLDFADPYNPDPNTPSFGASLETAGLFEALGSSALTAMRVCSTSSCPEAINIQAKFWFTDPAAADTTWRVDWSHIRVLRVSDSTWYFIADACDGSQVAGLSKLVGNRTKPRETNQGQYLVPLFISAERK